MFVFLDESGNFKGDEGECFVVGGFVTGDPRSTAKAFRKWQERKFPMRPLRYRTEVKFTDTRLANALRAQTLLYLTKQNLRIFYTFLRTKNIPLAFRKKKGIETGHLYTEIVVKTLEKLLPITDYELSIVLDRRQLKKVSQSEFRQTVMRHLLPGLPARIKLYVATMDSAMNPNLQIADWICGALYRYHAGRECGAQFYDTLHGSIVASGELFKDYWEQQNTPRSEAHFGEPAS